MNKTALRIIFSNTFHWAKMIRAKREAQLSLDDYYTSANCAACALFNLNRHYRGSLSSGRKGVFYGLKAAVIKVLAHTDYLVAVEQHERIHPCWHTREFNWHETDYCTRCDNSDIYRVEILYLFRFDINGIEYSWHQPEADCARWIDDVWYLAEIEAGEYENKELTREQMWNPDRIIEFEWILARYAGDGAEKAYYSTTIIEALRKDIVRWWHNKRYLIGFQFNELKRKHVADTVLKEDEISF